jgi:catechol 2,3-dioxygenase-like lactoylglutathione lyase family enzyme
MRKICLLMWLILPVLAQGQSVEATFAPALVAVKGAFFAISVPDMEASAKWYSEKLGLKVAMRDPKKNKIAVTVLAGGGLIVELIQADDAMPLRKAAPAITDEYLIHGIFKSGVFVDDLDKVLAMLKARNVEIAYGPFPAKENAMKNFIIKDNSGNLIQFFGK